MHFIVELLEDPNVRASVVLCSHVLVGSVFLVAGVPKLLDPRGSAIEMLDFRVMSPLVARVAGPAFAGANVITGTGLMLLAGWASWTGLALLGLYSAAVALALAWGLRIDCHCGPGSEPAGAKTLVRNAALAALVLVGITLPARWPNDIWPALIAGIVLGSLLAGASLPYLRLTAKKREA
ncbi:MAG: MauE/DoxX family redox-associated membrane protein [Candidatus Limnocylindria bacterium]